MSIALASIQQAAEDLAGQHQLTPLLEHPSLNASLGARILFKPECLQRTGSFKFRGAYTKLVRLSAEQRQRGVVAYSSGNHAQGVAAAAQIFAAKATIVMPEDAPKIKIDNTRALGAKVITYDRWRESREQIGAELAEREGATLVKPYDDEDVISGQGTVGLELVQQATEKGLNLDALLCPAGGGGLMAGISIAVSERSPNTQLYCVEPEHFDDTRRSLISGQREQNSGDHRSICDAIVTPSPGEITFPILKNRLSAGLSVSERQVAQAVCWAFERLKVVVEPGGAVALAALLAGKLEVQKGQVVAVVLSGGNIDPAQFETLRQQNLNTVL